MKLTAKLKLLIGSEDDKSRLLTTLETANRVCGYISKIVFEKKIWGQVKIHEHVYYDIREKFGLPFQLAVRCIAKVKHAYKSTKEQIRVENDRRRIVNRKLFSKGKQLLDMLELGEIKFFKWGAIPYDARNISFKAESVSIGTLNKRVYANFSAGPRSLELMKSRQGEADLLFQDGQFYLAPTCDIKDGEISEIRGYLGIDMGIYNVATDNHGRIYGRGRFLKRRRHQYSQTRAQLQKKGTKSANRRLRMRRRKEH